MNRRETQEPNYLEEGRLGSGFAEEESTARGHQSNMSSSNLFIEKSKEFFEKFQEKTKVNPQRALFPTPFGRTPQEKNTAASPFASRFPSFNDPLSFLTSETGKNTLRQAINGGNPNHSSVSPNRNPNQDDKQPNNNGGSFNNVKSTLDKIFQVNSSRPNPKDNPRSYNQHNQQPQVRAQENSKMEQEFDFRNQGKPHMPRIRNDMVNAFSQSFKSSQGENKPNNQRSHSVEMQEEEQEIFKMPVNRGRPGFNPGNNGGRMVGGTGSRDESPRHPNASFKQNQVTSEYKENRGSGEMSLENNRSNQEGRPKFDFPRNNDRQRNISEQEGRTFQQKPHAEGELDGRKGGFFQKREPRKEVLEENFFANRPRYQGSYGGAMSDNNIKPECVVLMVAEKPSIAKSIVESLAPNGQFRTRREISKYCSVYEFFGKIFDTPALIKVTSVTGHIYTTDFPQDYQDWKKVDPLCLFDAPTIKKESNPQNNLVQHLEKEAEGVTYLVLWLDNDKEGENICFEVLEICKKSMKKDLSIQNQILRAKFSSITKQDILDAYKNLKHKPNYNESIAVDARQIIDLKIGVAFSRFQTLYLTKKYEDLNQRKITFGPCQTPTLGFCVERDDEIKNFQPQTFYKPIPKIVFGKDVLSIEWDKERSYDEEEVQKIKTELEAIGRALVEKVINKEGIRGRPEALNTVQLLKISSSNLGMGPQKAMHVAERLYLEGYITYPRTESSSYPGRFDFAGVLEAVSQNPALQNYVTRMMETGFEKPKAGKDVGDHPPITPTTKPAFSLMAEEAKMYEFISRHYLATISRDAKFQKKIVKIRVGNHGFGLKGTTLTDPGFTEILPWIKIFDHYIPDFQEGQEFPLAQVDIHIGKTTPPEHLTESDLIALMEKNGIGTDASMATHINNVCEREYVKVVTSARRLVPTELGTALVHGYRVIDNELVAPDLRSSIETSVDLIAKGEINYDDVLNKVLELFKEKYIHYVNNIRMMDEFFSVTFLTFREALSTAKNFSNCGKCGNALKLLAVNNKLHCTTCRYTYMMPQQGTILLSQDTCKFDGFEMVIFIPNSDPTLQCQLCPCCDNKKGLRDLNLPISRATCSSCSNSDCNYNASLTEIGPCKKCPSGVLCYDHPSPRSLTVTCNGCQTRYNIGTPKSLSANVSPQKCEICHLRLLKVRQNDAKNGVISLNDSLVCMFCDPEFSQTVNELKTKRTFSNGNKFAEGNGNKFAEGNGKENRTMGYRGRGGRPAGAATGRGAGAMGRRGGGPGRRGNFAGMAQNDFDGDMGDFQEGPNPFGVMHKKIRKFSKQENEFNFVKT